MRTDNLKDKAYGMMKDKILRCEYAPGQPLEKAKLVEDIGVSFTPIREALNKLEHEGLVRFFPKRGVYVSEVTIASVVEIYEVRELLEPYFVEKFAGSIQKEKFEGLCLQLKKIEEEGCLDSHYSFDNELHNMFVSHSKNSYYKKFMEQIYEQNNRIRILSGRDSRERLRESNEEHKKILEAILEKDYAGGANAMKIHLCTSRDAALDAISKNNNVFF